jgi:hypothetical protein
MLSDKIVRLDGSTGDEEVLAESVSDLSVAEIEEISISDISRLRSNTLKDVLNDALRTRLEGHRGGTYTSPEAKTIGEANSVTV